MKKALPVLHINQFGISGTGSDFYAGVFRTHVKDHPITDRPHKHDFFVIVLFTKGSGVHEIDFTRYTIRPGTLFLLNPGQAHHWTLSKDADGIIFFHTREFFDRGFVSQRLRDLPFFNSAHNSPMVRLKAGDLAGPLSLFRAILKEYGDQKAMKKERLLSLVHLLYIHLARLYTPQAVLKSEPYLSKLRQFEDLLDLHFKQAKLPSYYAGLMHISERHLNRICRTCLNKSPTDLIMDRNVLEARRLLMDNKATMAEVAMQLGYDDQSYFSRLFKKRTGQTPSEFVRMYR
jgi:AraC family transcriptional regulator, transcriptional activator of pobA